MESFGKRSSALENIFTGTFLGSSTKKKVFTAALLPTIASLSSPCI